MKKAIPRQLAKAVKLNKLQRSTTLIQESTQLAKDLISFVEPLTSPVSPTFANRQQPAKEDPPPLLNSSHGSQDFSKLYEAVNLSITEHLIFSTPLAKIWPSTDNQDKPLLRQELGGPPNTATFLSHEPIKKNPATSLSSHHLYKPYQPEDPCGPLQHSGSDTTF